jgi:Fungal specific transcription factor domain
MEEDDKEFCIMPLTMDCIANPFRVRQESVKGSQYLLHAVLALSMQHLAKKNQDETLAQEMQVHRSTATHLYSEALSKSDALVLLDTLLILVNLDVSIYQSLEVLREL